MKGPLNDIMIKQLLEQYETENVQPEGFAPHAFVGPYHRWCELCNLPDRNPIHDSENIRAFQKKMEEQR